MFILEKHFFQNTSWLFLDILYNIQVLPKSLAIGTYKNCNNQLDFKT